MGNGDDDNILELLNSRIDLNLELKNEELYWEQRACVNWL